MEEEEEEEEAGPTTSRCGRMLVLIFASSRGWRRSVWGVGFLRPAPKNKKEKGEKENLVSKSFLWYGTHLRYEATSPFSLTSMMCISINSIRFFYGLICKNNPKWIY